MKVQVLEDLENNRLVSSVDETYGHINKIKKSRIKLDKDYILRDRSMCYTSLMSKAPQLELAAKMSI